MKSKTNLFFKLLKNAFGKLLQKVRSFPPLIIIERLLEAGILLSPKMVILEYNLRGWALIRACAFIRYFTVSNLHDYKFNENLNNEVKC